MSFHYFTPDGTRETRATISNEMAAALRNEWQEHMRTVSSCPQHFNGKGIVICAGGLGFFTCAWVSIKKLRNSGCTLPVEVWYYGNELNAEIISILGTMQVTCKNFLDYGLTANVGFMLKPLAIMHSSFEEILFLDADNICTGNPEHLFHHTAYEQHGAVFWPDYWRSSPSNPIWQITGARKDILQEQESGQLLINKRKCWKAINLCVYFNNNSFIYYRFLMGDKDTFKFAWLALDMPFCWVHREPGACGYLQGGRFYGTTIVQYNTDNEILFLHRNLCKWNFTPSGVRMWQKIKWFNDSSVPRLYTIETSPNKHGYVDIQGDTSMLDFREVLHNLEDSCMDILEELRTADFYQRFAASSETPRISAFNKQ